MFTNIQHIFFDLDHTLWDFDKNSEYVLLNLIQHYQLDDKCKCTPTEFTETYKLINHQLWEQYRKHHITKEILRTTRFFSTMKSFGYSDINLALTLEEAYITQSPHQKNLLPNTMEVLDYLFKKYTLHIITNGFKEVQQIKLVSGGLIPFFNSIFISEEIGYNKPDKRIFEHAENTVGTTAKNALMIGDNWEADVLGALNAGWKAIHFDVNTGENKNDVISITNLIELKRLL